MALNADWDGATLAVASDKKGQSLMTALDRTQDKVRNERQKSVALVYLGVIHQRRAGEVVNRALRLYEMNLSAIEESLRIVNASRELRNRRRLRP